MEHDLTQAVDIGRRTLIIAVQLAMPGTAPMQLLESVIPETISIYKEAKHERDLRLIKSKLNLFTTDELDLTKYLLEA